MVKEELCGNPHTEVLIRLNTIETRHKAHTWFMRIVGSILLISIPIIVTVTMNLNSTLIKITSDQEVCKEKSKSFEKSLEYLTERLDNGRYTTH
jgi:hypothetical protein